MLKGISSKFFNPLLYSKSIGIRNKSFIDLTKSAGCVLYLDARTATGTGLPSNSPLTSAWIDLIKDNDATQQNMAGTTASGVDVSNPLKPFWAFDGTDDHFALADAASIDITTAPLAVFMTVKAITGFTGGFLINKGSDVNYQYYIYWSTTSKRINCGVTGQLDICKSLDNSIELNNWYNIGFIWNGTNMKAYINCAYSNGTTGSFGGTLTSRTPITIGKRDADARHLKGNIATVTIYSGAKATETNILKAERAISKAYTG